MAERMKQGMQPHVLIAVVAYEAAAHLPELISRLGATVGGDARSSVLVLDDASADATAETATRMLAGSGIGDWQFFRSEQNQGYGGNQKVANRHALRSGLYTHVALLHGDCQHPPEALPIMLDKTRIAGTVHEFVIPDLVSQWP